MYLYSPTLRKLAKFERIGMDSKGRIGYKCTETNEIVYDDGNLKNKKKKTENANNENEVNSQE